MMGALIRALTNNAVENIEEALGMTDATSSAMKHAIAEWYAAWYGRAPTKTEDPCQRLPYAIVNKLCKATFGEYDSSLQHTDSAKEKYLDGVRSTFDACKTSFMTQAMIGGEAWAKPVPVPDGRLTWQIVGRDSVIILGRDASGMTQPCIDELIKDISRRVQKAGAITDTAEYQIYRAQALGEGKKAIEQAVSKQIGISEEVIASLFEYVADKSLSLDENGSLKRMTEAYTRMTQSKTRELLRDLWADTPEGKVQPLQTAYARAMDFAFRQVATGTLDLNTAIRRAVTPLAKRGLRTIEQKSGRSVGIEYACRRYIMDQLGQLDDEIQHADHDALGCDGWEISAHAACAPDHEPIQGRQYGDAEFEKLNNSLQRRIGHLNCGHTANPIILGVNAPQYTEAQLQKFKDDNERGVVYNGYRYTLYEAGQEQSRIENGIRLIKRQILADEETESPDLQKHQIKLRVVQAEYARFCKAVGLPTRSERLQVAGFGRSQSNRAVWAYKKAAPEQLRDVEIAGHKLYSVTDERIRAVPKPFFQGVSNKVNGLAQEYARGVLKKVQGLEVGTEAVVNFTKDGKCTGYYVGGQNSMKVKPPKMQVPYYSLHNHPSNGILSPEDIQQLIKRPQMQGIGAVGNAGALFTCEKVFGYSQKNAEGWFKALKKKYPLYKGESGKIEDALAQRIAFAEELRRDGAKYGLVFSR